MVIRAGGEAPWEVRNPYNCLLRGDAEPLRHAPPRPERARRRRRRYRMYPNAPFPKSTARPSSNPTSAIDVNTDINVDGDPNGETDINSRRQPPTAMPTSTLDVESDCVFCSILETCRQRRRRRGDDAAPRSRPGATAWESHFKTA